MQYDPNAQSASVVEPAAQKLPEAHTVTVDALLHTEPGGHTVGAIEPAGQMLLLLHTVRVHGSGQNDPNGHGNA